MPPLDERQRASAAQFDRQSAKYGKNHILAEVSDVANLLDDLPIPAGAPALDIATGGGHSALYLARRGCRVNLLDIAPRMLAQAAKLLREEGFAGSTTESVAETLPFDAGSFAIVASRVAPHHFSSPVDFVNEAARVLRPGGHFMLIDGSVPDNDAESEEWLHRVEKWRDPSHGRFLSRAAWENLVREAGLEVLTSTLVPRQQPDLDWYFKAANTAPENRALVLEAIAQASPHVRAAMRLEADDGPIRWWWPMLQLLARKPA